MLSKVGHKMRGQLILAAALGILPICNRASTRADNTQVIDRVIEPVLKGEAIVGCVVGIVDGNHTELHSYGEIHRGTGDKPNGETIYEIGSMTKVFTGTLLADMVNRKFVKLDAPVQDFLPPKVKLQLAKNQPIKLVDLASQTS